MTSFARPHLKWFQKLCCLFFLLFVGLGDATLFAQEFPERSSTLVTDYAGLLQDRERQALENKLVAFSDSTSTQIAIVIVKTLDGYPIADYAIQLGEKWGVGEKGKNNGVLILVAAQDHKMFISTGRGLEAVIPDAICKRIVTNDLRPAFKQDQYYSGLDAATNTIMALAKGEFTAADYAKNHGQGGKQGIPWFIVLLIFGVIMIVVIFKVRGVNNYARSNNIPFWIAWGLLNAASRRSHGSWSDFSSGSGGFGGGSSSGGGGFGGFGGGSFGGGGAGGDW